MRDESSEGSSILLKHTSFFNALDRLLPMTGDFRQPFTSGFQDRFGMLRRSKVQSGFLGNGFNLSSD